MIYFAPSGVRKCVAGDVIQFGEFVLDCNRFELLRDGLAVKLEKIPLELLILLARKQGH